jgi:hypothetical protein
VDGESLLPGWGFVVVHSRTYTVREQREIQMVGKTHQNLKAGVGWKSSKREMVPGGAIKERKERKGWESSKKGGEAVGMGEEDSSLCLRSESELGKSSCYPLLFRL